MEGDSSLAICHRHHMSGLPEEVLMHIFGYLTPRERLVASRVCRCFKRIGCSREFWAKADVRGSVNRLPWDTLLGDQAVSGNRLKATSFPTDGCHYVVVGAKRYKLDRSKEQTVRIASVGNRRLRDVSEGESRVRLPLDLRGTAVCKGVIGMAALPDALVTVRMEQTERGEPLLTISKQKEGVQGGEAGAQIDASRLLHSDDQTLDQLHLQVYKSQLYLVLSLTGDGGKVVRNACVTFDYSLPTVFQWETEGECLAVGEQGLCLLKGQHNEVWHAEEGCLIGHSAQELGLSQIRRWGDHWYILDHECLKLVPAKTSKNGVLAPALYRAPYVHLLGYHPQRNPQYTLTLIGDPEQKYPECCIGTKGRFMFLFTFTHPTTPQIQAGGMLGFSGKVEKVVFTQETNRFIAQCAKNCNSSISVTRIVDLQLDGNGVHSLKRRRDLENDEVNPSQIATTSDGKVVLTGQDERGVTETVHYRDAMQARDDIVTSLQGKSDKYQGILPARRNSLVGSSLETQAREPELVYRTPDGRTIKIFSDDKVEIS